MALRVRADALRVETGIDTGRIGPASRLVSELTGYAVQPNKAIVGRECVRARGRHPPGRDAQAPRDVRDHGSGGARPHHDLPLGKHSGRHAFGRACHEAGLQLDRRELAAAFTRFKLLADTRSEVTLHEAFEEEVAA